MWTCLTKKYQQRALQDWRALRCLKSLRLRMGWWGKREDGKMLKTRFRKTCLFQEGLKKNKDLYAFRWCFHLLAKANKNSQIADTNRSSNLRVSTSNPIHEFSRNLKCGVGTNSVSAQLGVPSTSRQSRGFRSAWIIHFTSLAFLSEVASEISFHWVFP